MRNHPITTKSMLCTTFLEEVMDRLCSSFVVLLRCLTCCIEADSRASWYLTKYQVLPLRAPPCLQALGWCARKRWCNRTADSHDQQQMLDAYRRWDPALAEGTVTLVSLVPHLACACAQNTILHLLHTRQTRRPFPPGVHRHRGTIERGRKLWGCCSHH